MASRSASDVIPGSDLTWPSFSRPARGWPPESRYLTRYTGLPPPAGGVGAPDCGAPVTAGSSLEPADLAGPAGLAEAYGQRRPASTVRRINGQLHQMKC